MLLGNMRVVSEQTGISYPVLCSWKNADWWPELVAQVKKQKQAKTNNSIVKLIEQSLDVMQDRLDNGDWVFDQKNGTSVRKPVSVRDATAIATSLLQRQQVAEEMESRQATTSATVQETLSLLAAEFKKYTGKPILKDVEDAVEISPKDKLPEHLRAIHEKRRALKEYANKGAVGEDVFGGEDTIQDSDEEASGS